MYEEEDARIDYWFTYEYNVVDGEVIGWEVTNTYDGEYDYYKIEAE